MTIIEKVKAEIDKWKNCFADATGEYADGAMFVLRYLDLVLSTLEKAEEANKVLMGRVITSPSIDIESEEKQIQSNLVEQ